MPGVTRKMKSSIAMMPEPHRDTLKRFTCPLKNLRMQQKDLSELKQSNNWKRTTSQWWSIMASDHRPGGRGEVPRDTRINRTLKNHTTKHCTSYSTLKPWKILELKTLDKCAIFQFLELDENKFIQSFMIKSLIWKLRKILCS